MKKEYKTVAKVLRGERVIFVGERSEIEALHNSAFNFGFVGTNSEIENLGEQFAFSVRTENILVWRGFAALIERGVDLVNVGEQTALFAVGLATKWLDSLPVIPAWTFCLRTRSELSELDAAE